MKRIFYLCSFLFIFVFSSEGQTGFQVLITAFDQEVPPGYFKELGKISIKKDQNGLNHIYLAETFANREEAATAAKQAKMKGFQFARVVDWQAVKEMCSAGCREPLYVENLFFDFDRYNLRQKSKSDLQDLAALLTSQPSYRVILMAHTDAKGSNEYNIQLSQNRAKSAKDYLIGIGIDEDRIETGYSGETQPIAVNQMGNGTDAPQGRQFNRRVEITVLDGDGKVVPNLVEPIRVPEKLKL
ncbi:MAG: OmpA family protein [Saprospiraceae bacterium]